MSHCGNAIALVAAGIAVALSAPASAAPIEDCETYSGVPEGDGEKAFNRSFTAFS